MGKKSIGFIIIVFFACLAGYPLLHNGLIPTHDGEYHIVRFFEFDKVIRAGQLYPRWQPDMNNGYGSPLFNYYYPFANYVAFFFHNFGMSFITAFSAQLFFSFILGAIGMYLWIRSLWGEYAGIFSSVLYTFAPYHLVDVYVRGAIGEAWVLAFMPLFLWILTIACLSFSKRYSVLAGVFLAVIIFSHNILAVIFSPFSITYAFLLFSFSKNKQEVGKTISMIFLIGLGLSAIFWFPAILERGYTIGLKIYDVKEGFPELYQLLFPSWGTGFSSGDLQNQMSFQIGVINIFLAFFGIIFLIYSKRMKRFMTFFLGWFFLAFFMMLPITMPAWEYIPFLNYFQFPWRLLSIIILVAAAMGGIFFRESSFLGFGRKISLYVLVFAVITPVILTITYTYPSYYHYRDDSYYTTRSNFMNGTNTPGNAFNTKWFSTMLSKKESKLSLKKGESTVITEKISPIQYQFLIHVAKPSLFDVNVAYFPGWIVEINGKKTQAVPNKDGTFSFALPQGEQRVVIQLTQTTVQRIGTSLAFLTACICLSLFLRRVLQKKFSYALKK